MIAEGLTLTLNGLDCPDCASKIETGLRKLGIVESVTVDFINRSATASLKPDISKKDALMILTKEIHKIDPGVSVSSTGGIDAGEHEENRAIKQKAVQYSIGISLAVLAFFIPNETLKVLTFLCSYVTLGYETLIKLFKNLANGQVFDENFLMGIATFGAIILGEYPEAVGVMLFYNIGEFCQDMAVDKSRRSIKSLLSIKPDNAWLVTENGVVGRHPKDIEKGSVILVKPGERVPIDGVILTGKTQLDTSALTGESVPRLADEGDTVLSGSINVTCLVKIKTSELYEDSTVVRILDMVTNVSSKKAPTEQFITKFSRYYTPAVVLAAVCLALIPPFVLGQPVSEWAYRGLILLVISCPCALVLSVPLGYFAGIGACSKKGILVKGGNYLDELTNAKTIVFDKTGTLTKGSFSVTEIMPFGFDENELLKIAANIENFSNHPIGRSIVSFFDGPLEDGSVSEFEEISGFGVKALFQGKICYLGNAPLLKKQNIVPDEIDGFGSVVYIAADGKYAGRITVSDEIKEDGRHAVDALKKAGITTVMLTGDNRRTAERIGGILGIEQVYSELLPDEKLKKLESIMSAGKKKTAFVGDGINDAPSLARADVSIAMGGLGQDAAIEASDIVIMTDEPSKVADAVAIAKSTKRIVWQNIVFSLSVKALVLALGAAGIATMWMATFADVGVSLLAVLNSMRSRY